MSDILILKGNGQYGAIEYFADKLGEAFNDENIIARVLDLNTISLDNIVDVIIKEKPKLCIAFNTNGFKIMNKQYYDYLNINHLAVLVDHPMYHISEMDLKSNNLIVTCIDEKNIHYLRNKNDFNNSFRLYHGVDKNIRYETNDKKFDLVFFGSMFDYKGQWKDWKEKFNGNINKILDSCIEIGMYNSFLSADEILDYVLNYYGYELDKVNYMNLNIGLLPEIDRYLRFFHRHKFLEKIQSNRINIYGNGPWEKYFNKNNKNIEINPGNNIEDAIKIMQRAKMTVNCSMHTYYGSHERPFMAAMAGSVVLSNYSPLFEEVFGENALLADLKNMDDIDDRINLVLRNDDLRIEMTDHCRSFVYNEHTWNNRAREIAVLLNKIKS